MSTVPELFESVAAMHTGLPALNDGVESLSYGQLNARANQLARKLIADGVAPDSLVAVAMPKRNDLVVAILAVLKAGGAYLPLDPSYPSDRLLFMLRDARPTALLRTADVASPLPALPETVIDDPLQRQALSEYPDHDVQQHERRGELRPEHLMYVIYTSGSTGVPKGVAVSHEGVPDMLATQVAVLGAGPGDRVLQWASISFDAAFWDVSLALLCGATLVMSSAEDLLPGLTLQETLLKRDITYATLPPVALSATDADGVLVGGTIMSTGDSCTPTLVRKWAPGRRMFNGYGPTEVTVGATISGPIRDAENIGIGDPWIGNRVLVLDDRLRPVPDGVEGEFYISGSGLARGYLNRIGTTAVSFVPAPYGPPGERMYRTGDRGCTGPDGSLYFSGRADGQVKVRGYRVELGEIESRLAAHPVVDVAVAVVRGNLADAEVVAYVTTTTSIDPGDLRSHLVESLPAFMVPSHIELLESFPTLVNGKIDRAALPEAGSRTAESHPGPAGADGIVAVVCEVVRDVLEAPRVLASDNFFALGGHSMQLTRLVARIRDDFDVRLPIRVVMAAETVGDLATEVERLRAQNAATGVDE